MSDGERWRMIQPALSWGVGIGLLIWVTFTEHGEQTAAWYVVIGALLGFPFLTLGGNGRRNGTSSPA